VWFDAHLDLACMALNGRDIRNSDLSACGGQDLPAAVTLPSLREGGVRACLATIFTEAGGTDAVGYPAGDAAAAHQRGLEQAREYARWASEGLVSIRGLGSVAIGPDSAPMRMGLLMECADPIRTHGELAEWLGYGLVAIGLAWARGSRYAGGNTDDNPLTPEGRALVAEMDRLGVVHDTAHLSDRALADLFETTDRPVIASHSNCRSLIDTDGQTRQRHLTDSTIREIVRRKGMIGVNVFSAFILPAGNRERRATPGEWAAHVNHICELAGDRSHVGLGSDMDGGFSAATMPQGVDKPADLVVLCAALRNTGWSDADIENFRWGNWSRFWQSRAPGLVA
jgi:membrane dipeptidase